MSPHQKPTRTWTYKKINVAGGGAKKKEKRKENVALLVACSN